MSFLVLLAILVVLWMAIALAVWCLLASAAPTDPSEHSTISSE